MSKRAHRCASRLSIAAALSLSAGLASPALAQVWWKSGGDQALARMGAADVGAALGEVGAGAREGGARRVVVQFDAPVTPEQRRRLSAAGLRLMNSLGNDAYFASVAPAHALDLGAIAAERTLISVRSIERRWKLHSWLENDLVPTWAVVNAGDQKEGAEPVEARFAVYALFHEDVDTATEGMAIAARHGAFVRSRLISVPGMVLEVDRSQVKALAEEDGVMWVEPALWQFDTTNASNRLRTGADEAQAAPYGLTGAGVSVMVFDGGTIRATHQDFQGRATNRDSDGVSDHATHVSGTIGGAGIANPNHKGMAPGVTIQNYGFEWAGGNDFLYSNPGDLEADYNNAINSWGADIANNSIGNNTSPNGNPCEWQGNYGVTDTLIDAIARGSLSGGEAFRIVWANGNERQSSACQNDGPAPGTGYATLAPPANAKNHLTVGALHSNNDAVTSFTSWGPSDDGRMKPDVSAPGSQNGADGAGGNDGGVTSCSSTSDTSYSVKSGTSMASPTVCGLAALLLEDWRNQFPGEPDPLQSTVKALFAHNAVDIVNIGPDYQTGYGSVRIVPTIEHLRSENFVENSVGQGGVASYLVVVNPGETFKATLVWDDPPGTPNVTPALINNLDLRVFDPNGVQRHPWTLNPLIPALPASRTGPNTLDNIEQVFVGVGVEEVPAGVWRVEVVGTNVPQGPQTFSLAASPMLINCSTRGVASLDKAVYSCATGTLTASVTDCDLNLDDMAVESINVLVTSSSDPAGEMVTLIESGAQTADFRGVLPLTTGGGGGALSIGHGDTVSFTYIDADDGFGNTNVAVTATATVDCLGPEISNVVVTNIQPYSATVTFSTSEGAVGSVTYGATCGGTGTTASATGLATTHSINLSGLAEDTTYYVRVGATDGAGNASTNDNGGACFVFGTPDIPNFHTENFDTADNRDLDFTTVTFTPDGSVDHYRSCVESASALPTDPAGGQVLSFVTSGGSATSDDGYALVNLTGGAMVKLYGALHPRLYVGTNGYITFTEFDTDYTEAIADHFDTARLSLCFDDLRSDQGGQVSFKQLADRAVVTWLNVPEYNATGTLNTFQAEMFFDGVIRLTWLAMSAADGISGLSAGGGTPVGFTPSDLSAGNNCSCPGDVNGDNVVDFADINLLLDNYGDVGAGLPGDLDGDGDVDFTDLNTLLDNYGLAC